MMTEKMRKRVHVFLMNRACPNKYRGVYYLRDGLCWAFDNLDNIGCLSKSVYLAVADKYATGINNVERSLRTLADKWWVLNQCGGLFDKKPTNAELFHTLVVKISVDFDIAS